MKKVLKIILFVCSFLGISCQSKEVEGPSPVNPEAEINDMSLICERIIDTIMKEDDIDNEYVMNLYSSMLADGSWTDIDYQDDEPSDWMPSWHIQRLRLISFAYFKEDCALYHDSLLWTKVVESLEFWSQCNAHSSNWWWPNIGEPMFLIDVLLLYKKAHNEVLDVDLYKKLRARFPEFNPGDFTGANKADVSAIQLKFALYEENDKVISESLTALYSAVTYGGTDGFKLDGSFWSDIPHIYLGGYSEVLMSNVIQYAYHARDTKYQIPEEKLSVLRDFLTGLYSSVIRGHVMAFNCHGRSISRPDGSLDKSSYGSIFAKLSEIDDGHTSEYLPFLARLNGNEVASFGIESRNYHCFESDYMSHVREDFSVAIRKVSKQTWRDEYENNENLKGYFVADGSTNIGVTGEEYFNIMPLWDWTYIPGTTAPNIDDAPLPYWGQTGVSSFCGGVSDGVYGISTLKYYDDYKGLNTGANKGYFMFDDELVCLGSNVKSDHECHTTVNQCWQNGITAFCTRDGIVNIIGESSDSHLSNSNMLWCSNSDLGYYFPFETEIDLITENRQGTWYDINHGYGSTDVQEGRVFQLSISHKNSDKYAYIVRPLAAGDMSAYVRDCPVQVLENTDSIQAVFHRGLNMVQAIFYDATSLEVYGYEITVSNPCVLLIPKLGGTSMDVYISDPTKLLSDITISVGDNSTCKTTSRIVNLTEGHLGQSNHVVLE